MVTRPDRSEISVLIFLICSVRTTVPLVRMLPRPAVHYGDAGTEQSQMKDEESIGLIHHHCHTLTCDLTALVGVHLMPHGGWR